VTTRARVGRPSRTRQRPILSGTTSRRGARVIDWLFRDRHTGRITVAQFPNPPLAVFLGATVVHRLIAAGAPRTAVGVLATAALLWWAVDELLRGVNPWRRLLGGVVLAAEMMHHVR
jgi:hypothetical protein